MTPYNAALAAQHREDLQREADQERLARLAKRAGSNNGTDRGGSELNPRPMKAAASRR